MCHVCTRCCSRNCLYVVCVFPDCSEMTAVELLLTAYFQNLTSLTLQRLNENLFNHQKMCCLGLQMWSEDLTRTLKELHISGELELQRDYVTRVKGN